MIWLEVLLLMIYLVLNWEKCKVKWLLVIIVEEFLIGVIGEVFKLCLFSKDISWWYILGVSVEVFWVWIRMLLLLELMGIVFVDL